MASTRAIMLLALLALTAVASARTLQTESTRNFKPRPNEKSPKGPVKLNKPQPKPLKLNITKPELPRPTGTKPDTTKPHLDPITKINTTVVFNLLNKTEQACLDKIFNWTSIKTLKPWEQCGGAGANCTAFGKESTHCIDAPFYDWLCPDNYTCTQQDDNTFFYQCVPANMTSNDHGNDDMDVETRMGAFNTSSNSSEPMIITGFNTTIEWEKLPQKEQEEVSKCLGWPISPIKKLKSYEMCGGMAPQMCGKYGNTTEVCKDREFTNWECPMGEECVRQDKWFWQCKPKPQAELDG